MSRVSSTQMVFGYLNQIKTTEKKYTDLFKQGDGNRLHYASDDSVAYAKYLRLQNYNSGNEQYQKNIKSGLSWMKTSNKSLSNVVDIFTTFTERTVGAANSTNTESDMHDIAKELMQQIGTVVDEMNTQQGDRYIFAGQSDTVRPYMISADKMDRGETKTLDEKQLEYFDLKDLKSTGTVTQFLTLTGDDGNKYFFNTRNGKIYDSEFFNEGYKKNVLAGITTEQPDDAVDTYTASFDIGDYFKSNGVINDAGRAWNANIDVDGKTVNVKFSTIRQYVANYAGDDKAISIVTQVGSTKPEADTINVSGQQIYGSDIFDCDAIQKTGTAMLNEMLAVAAKVDSNDRDWVKNDGLVLTDAAVKSILNAQTTTAAREQAYEAAEDMLISQNELLKEEIGIIGGSDITKLSTQLVQCSTIYNLALAMGNKLFPGSLGDYL